MPRTQVDFEPIGRRVEVDPGTTLLAAAQSAGVELVSICGGAGLCDSCRVRLASGSLSRPTLVEEEVLDEAQLAAGYRLACQAVPVTNVRVDIPPESLATPQRLQIEGQETGAELDPVVAAVDLELAPASLEDLRSDERRLLEALAARGSMEARLGLPVLSTLSDSLRAQGWAARVVVRQGEVVALLPPASRLLGLAVDVGTTKLAAYLMDLTDGTTLSLTGAMNPQVAYGEDVVSRIAYSNEHPDGRRVLQAILVDSLNKLVAELCLQAGVSRRQIVEAVMVGNTAMHHLLAGLPVRQLGQAPYVAAVSHSLDAPARDIGLDLAAGARLFLPPNIAGYVGADHVAMLLATQVWKSDQTVIALDIGTNTEISLASRGRLLCCSCASGPAFEGAHIHDGMRAAPGAIERVQVIDGAVRTFTIGGQAPVGICGSGILDAVAELLRAGALDERGALQAGHPLVRVAGGKADLVLAPAGSSGHGRDVVVTRRDINEIQLAKAAIRAGAEVLLAEAGVTPEDVDQVVVAGAFGTYIDIRNALEVGMFPPIPAERFRQVGNAAGMGAKRMLVSAQARRTAEAIAQRVAYVELTVHPGFTDTFIQAMYLRPRRG